MPTITQLNYILAVHRIGHFGRAAEECHVSQPSLSAQIQKVEEELDLIIFDRSKKPVLTTDKGKLFILQAKKVIQEHEKLLHIKSSDGILRGDFHLGVIPTLSSNLTPLFVEGFSRQYPEVELKISEYKTTDILSKLYDDELDGGLLVTPLHDAKIIERSLFLEPFYAFTSKNHQLSKKNKLNPEDLGGDDILILNEGHCFRNQVLNLCSTANQSHSMKNVTFESGSLETLINLIRQGSGYTLLPHLATLHLSEKERQENMRAFIDPIPTREVSLVHSRSVLKEEILDALVKSIVSSLPKELTNLKRSNVEVVEII